MVGEDKLHGDVYQRRNLVVVLRIAALRGQPLMEVLQYSQSSATRSGTTLGRYQILAISFRTSRRAQKRAVGAKYAALATNACPPSVRATLSAWLAGLEAIPPG